MQGQVPWLQVQLQWQPVQDLFWIKAFLWNKALFWNKAIWRYKTQTFAFAQLSAHMSKLNVSAGSRNCDYECTNGGGCTVTYVGPPRAGKTQVEFQRKDGLPKFMKHLHNFWCFTDFIFQGSCFPRDFGGSCSGTPRECQDCKHAINC